MKLGVAAPAPDDPAKRAELATLLAGMEAKYGSAKDCPQGPASCRDEVQLKSVLEKSRDYDELLAAWKGWHDAARPLRPDYERYVTLANEGAGTLGFRDLGAMWRSGYDMPADDVHEGSRAALRAGRAALQGAALLRARRGSRRSTARTRCRQASRFPAHLLGNMWAQQWNDIYDLLEPYPA